MKIRPERNTYISFPKCPTSSALHANYSKRAPLRLKFSTSHFLALRPAFFRDGVLLDRVNPLLCKLFVVQTFGEAPEAASEASERCVRNIHRGGERVSRTLRTLGVRFCDFYVVPSCVPIMREGSCLQSCARNSQCVKAR